LWLIGRSRGAGSRPLGSWPSALALFAYAAGFSYAYISLTAATGALLLFGAVQATMISWGLWHGERLAAMQATGLLIALGGLVGLVLPGLSAPPLAGALLMLGAGVAWGVYSLRAKGSGDPTQATAGNFLRAAPLAIVLSLLTATQARVDMAGAIYAALSGAVASGLGYAVWYTALRGAKPAQHGIELRKTALRARRPDYWGQKPHAAQSLINRRSQCTAVQNKGVST
jgi:drug/metabolite transporter (DMT)-like permease